MWELISGNWGELMRGKFIRGELIGGINERELMRGNYIGGIN